MLTFEDVYQDLPAAGWLAENEASLLWSTVLATAGDVLEIGSYQGRSAKLIAAALHRRRSNPGVYGQDDARLYCVDPFYVGFDGVDTPASDEQILAEFAHNVLASPYSQYVSLAWMTEVKFRHYWPKGKRFGVVYIDGDHSFAGTLGALLRWAPLANVVVLHDYGRSFPEVKRAVESYGKLQLVELAHSLAVMKAKTDA